MVQWCKKNNSTENLLRKIKPTRSIQRFFNNFGTARNNSDKLFGLSWGHECNYERASAASGASSFVFKAKIWVFAARPGPTRPDPITLFKALYLRNRMSDRQAVFFDEYHLDVKVVWHGYHIASVPVMARGACQTWGTLDDPQNTLPQ